jgi:NADH:ubiquinone oxidoreductase subunit 2 (subunit N)
MEELKVILPQDIGTFGNLSFSIEHFALVCFSLILVGILFKLGVVPVHF